MIACPSCKRRVFTGRDMLYATLDGEAPCPVCGRHARLDVSSRLMVSCVLAIALSAVFLHGGVFYSGHFFLTGLFIVLGGWRILASLGLPFLMLETVSGPSINRRQSILILILLLASSIVLDSIMSSRFEFGGTV